MSASKLVELSDAAGLVPDGASIAVGGLSLNVAPMAFCRELVRAGTRDLELVAIVSGMSTDWLIGGGCVKRLIMGLTSFEGFGLAPMFRRAAETGAIEVEEYSEHTMICMLQAAAARRSLHADACRSGHIDDWPSPRTHARGCG